MCPPGPLHPKGPSCARIIIGLVAPTRSAASLTMSCLWVLPGSGHWCSSGLVPTLCLWSKAGMPGLPSRVIFAGATFVALKALGDELHYVFDCPHFSDIRSQYPALYQDADGCMRLFVWHIDQKAVSHCLTAILNRAKDMNTDSSS